MNKQPAVTEQTKANLRAAFWKLYVDRPISKITVRQITDAAGYNRGTFYLYYRDVYDLLESIEDELLDTLESLVHERILKDGRLDLRGNAGFIVRLARDYAGYFSVLLGENGDPSFCTRFKEIIAPLVETCLPPEGSVLPEERDLLLEFYLSGLLAVVTAWLQDDRGVPIDRFVQLVAGAVLDRQAPRR